MAAHATEANSSKHHPSNSRVRIFYNNFSGVLCVRSQKVLVILLSGHFDLLCLAAIINYDNGKDDA